MGFEKKFNDWKECRRKTKRKLFELADKLDNFHMDSTYSRLNGTMIGILGTAAVLSGVLLAPNTFGISLTLTICGITIGALGNVTSIMSSIKEDIRTRNVCKEAEKLINEEKKKTNELIELISNCKFRRQLENGFSSLFVKCAQDSLNIANIVSSAMSVKHIGHVSGSTSSGGTTAAKILLKPSKTIQLFGFSLSLLILGIELVKLVETSLEIKHGSKSMYSERIRLIALSLEHNFNELEHLINEEEIKFRLVYRNLIDMDLNQFDLRNGHNLDQNYFNKEN